MKKKDGVETIDINTIKDPSFLKSLDNKELARLCEQLREEILRVCSTYGGHLSSNLGDVELTVALHKVFDFPKDKLIFDVGHQCYAHKLLTGRKLDHINEKGFPNGFQNRKESPYDPYDAGHSSTALSAAEAFAFARDLQGEDYNVIALVGDASIVNGLSFEALNNIGERRNKVIVILNDNAMSITKPIGGAGKFFRKISTGKLYNKAKKGYQRALYRTAVGHKIYDLSSRFKRVLKSRLVPITMFDNMGFTYIGPVDGHNLRALEKAMKSAKNATKSVVIHCRTLKGKGYPKAEIDKKGDYHAVAPFDIKKGLVKDQNKDQTNWSSLYASFIEEEMRSNQETILVTPATLKGSELEKAFEEFKDRCVDVGIAEEHALTFAGALSIAGKRPIVSIYSSFMQRAYDEISHDCARMGAKVTLLIDRAGLVGKNGETHQGIYDVAFLKSIPHVVVSMAATPEIAKSLFEKSFDYDGVFAIRYPGTNLADQGEIKPAYLPSFCWRGFQRVNAKLAVIGVGPLGETLRLKLEENNVEASFFDPVYLNPVPKNEVEKLLGYESIVVYDPYSTEEGFCQSLLSSLMKMSYKGKVTSICVKSDFISYDTLANQLEDSGCSVEQAFDKIAVLLK